MINYHQHTSITINYLGKLPSQGQSEILNYHQHVKYLYLLQCGKCGYNWFNLGPYSRSKCPSIRCTNFTSREALEIEISSIVLPYRSTPSPIFVGGNCVDGNLLPIVVSRHVQDTHVWYESSYALMVVDYSYVLFISFRVTSLVPGLSHDDPTANEAALLNVRQSF